MKSSDESNSRAWVDHLSVRTDRAVTRAAFVDATATALAALGTSSADAQEPAASANGEWLKLSPASAEENTVIAAGRLRAQRATLVGHSLAGDSEDHFGVSSIGRLDWSRGSGDAYAADRVVRRYSPNVIAFDETAIRIQRATGYAALSVVTSTDTYNRVQILSSGTIRPGPGNAATDAAYRAPHAAGVLRYGDRRSAGLLTAGRRNRDRDRDRDRTASLERRWTHPQHTKMMELFDATGDPSVRCRSTLSPRSRDAQPDREAPVTHETENDERATSSLSPGTLELFDELLGQLSISAGSAVFDAQRARVSTARRELHDAPTAADARSA